VPPVAGAHYDIFINNNADLYELIERTQIEGPWPIDHPLPLPRWASKPKDCYQLGSLTQYEKLAGSIEMHVQRLLEEHNYNTVGNFVDLYQNFKKSGYCTFFKFFQRYNTPNPPNLHHVILLVFFTATPLRSLRIITHASAWLWNSGADSTSWSCTSRS
jgi:hypothetical protein